MPDFWTHCGYHLLDRTADGRLTMTDDFLKAYLARPEIRPVHESCHGELALHRDLLKHPRIGVAPQRLATLEDSDARDNYGTLLAFRDALLRFSTIEAFYLAVVRGEIAPIPTLFLDQIVQVIVRSVLDGREDPIQVRAAELLFRPQKVTITGEAILMADEETVEMRAVGGDTGGEELIEVSAPRLIELDVLQPDAAELYWSRSDAFDTVLNASLVSFGQDAIARVLEAWIRHFLDVPVAIQPVASIRDERWRWHIGLDVEATAILNDLYEGRPVPDDRLYRLLALFRLEFRGPAAVLPEMAGRPVYLGMAMTESGRLRLKPQNLLVNLPVAAPA